MAKREMTGKDIEMALFTADMVKVQVDGFLTMTMVVRGAVHEREDGGLDCRYWVKGAASAAGSAKEGPMGGSMAICDSGDEVLAWIKQYGTNPRFITVEGADDLPSAFPGGRPRKFPASEWQESGPHLLPDPATAARRSTWYRVETDLMCGPKMAGDVIRHERDDLGNAMPSDPILLQHLDICPARKIVWACKTRKAARRYGRAVEAFDAVAMVIAEDGDAGYLLLLNPDESLLVALDGAAATSRETALVRR